MNARDTTKVYIWKFDTGYGLTLFRTCHSHNTPGKGHNNTWVEPLAGNYTTSSTRYRKQVWQNVKYKRTYVMSLYCNQIEKVDDSVYHWFDIKIFVPCLGVKFFFYIILFEGGWLMMVPWNVLLIDTVNPTRFKNCISNSINVVKFILMNT